MSGLIILIVLALVFVLALLAIVGSLGQRYIKVGPNQALIIYGRGSPKVINNGGKFVAPIFQRAQAFSLERQLRHVDRIFERVFPAEMRRLPPGEHSSSYLKSTT